MLGRYIAVRAPCRRLMIEDEVRVVSDEGLLPRRRDLEHLAMGGHALGSGEPRSIRAVPLMPQHRPVAVLQQVADAILRDVKRRQIVMASQTLPNAVIEVEVPRA